jgi:hypothetical protein
VVQPFRFSASVHVNYAETVLPMRRTPALKDFSKEFGGSGEVIAE